jgi:cytochrome c biogenesis protein CcdA
MALEPCPTIFHLANPSSLNFSVITLAALVDSINPCAIAVLLILLETLLLTDQRKKALKIGLIFILGLYITYFIFGIGLFSALSLEKIQQFAPYLHKIIGGLAILIGLFNIKDFFFYGKGFVMEIPRAWRPQLGAILRTVTSPIGALLVGAIVTLFELPCTGGPYIFALGYLSSITTCLKAIPIILYYNLIFVLPLLILTGLLVLGFANIESAHRWREKNVRLLHLIAGIIMLGLGIWVILS